MAKKTKKTKKATDTVEVAAEKTDVHTGIQQQQARADVLQKENQALSRQNRVLRQAVRDAADLLEPHEKSAAKRLAALLQEPK